jgi:hypothetical protein
VFFEHTTREGLRSCAPAAARALHPPVMLTLLLLSALALLTAAPAASAGASSWTQSDWSGGAGARTWSSTASFDSSSDLLSSDPGRLTLGQTAQHGDGDGNDGAATVSGSVNLSTENLTAGRTCADGGDAVAYALADNAPAGSSTLTLGGTPSAGCLQAGDEVLIMDLQGGDANDASGVGTYETGSIDAVSGAALTLQSPLANSYSTVDGGGDSEAVMVQRVPNYTDVTIDFGATLATSAFNGSTGGALFFRATGTVTINGTIEADGLGYSGGQATAPSGSDVPANTGAGAIPGLDQNAGDDQGGGGGSSNSTGSNDSTGGGGGGNAGAGGAGANRGVGGANATGSGGAPSADSLTTFLPGGGGGAGGGVDTGCSVTADALPGGSGGAGGGVIVISANAIVDDGRISADGTDGAQRPLNPNDPDSEALDDSLCGGGGGGGAGGSVFLAAVSDANLAGGAVTASGGNGGDGVMFGGAGSGGGGGSVLISSGSTTEFGADAVMALGGQPGTPVSGGASAGSDSSGAVELWEPTAATASGTSDPAVSVQPLTGYAPSGELTSSIFDAGMAAGAVWDTLADTATTPAGTSAAVRVRTGEDSDLSDAPSFSTCPALSSGASLSGDTCVTEGDRYAQYQVELVGGADTPTLTGISITYQSTAAIDAVPVAGPPGAASPNPAPPTLVLNPASGVLPTGTVTTRYTEQLSSNGGTAPYTYSISSGALPAGLSLSSHGLLSGTPTTAGTARFTIVSRDTGGATITARYTLPVSRAPSDPQISVATAATPGGGLHLWATPSAPGGPRMVGYRWTVNGRSVGRRSTLSYTPSRRLRLIRISLTWATAADVARTGSLTLTPASTTFASVVHFRESALDNPGAVAALTARVKARVAALKRRLLGAVATIGIAGYAAGAKPYWTHQLADEQWLSHGRAVAVYAALRSALGSVGVHYRIRWYGGRHPLRSNRTAAGRARNRRVTIRVIATGWILGR